MKYNPYTRYTIVGNVLDLINSKIPAVTWPTPPNNNKAENNDFDMAFKGKSMYYILY